MKPLGKDNEPIKQVAKPSTTGAASSKDDTSPRTSETTQAASHTYTDFDKAQEIVRTSIPQLMQVINQRRAQQIEEALPNPTERLARVKASQKYFLSIFQKDGRILLPQKDWNRLNEIMQEDIERGGYESYESRQEKNTMFEALNDQQGYRTNRNLADYDECYKAMTGVSIKDKLQSLSQEGKPLNIFDEGCGDGKALKDIKDEFSDRVHTIGLGLSDLKSPDAVDEYHKSSAEAWLSKKPLDFIFSYCGGTYYSQEEVKWPLMLKNAFSLSEDGEAMFVLYLDKDLKGYQGQDLSAHKKELLEQIKQYFDNNGFEFQCKSFPHNRFSAIDLPPGHETDIVIIRRK